MSLSSVFKYPAQLLIFFLITLFPFIAEARKTNFTEKQTGITLGVGTYFYLLPNDNKWDPVPELAQAGVTTANSKSTYIVPTKFGYFYSIPRASIEAYLRYVVNFFFFFSVEGSHVGPGTSTGSTNFGSWGGGANFSAVVAPGAYIRLNIAINAEYILQRATLIHNLSEGEEERMHLGASSVIFGGGLQPQFWLGNMWSLSLFAGYQYGLTRNWSATKDGVLFGNIYTTGALVSPLSAGAIQAQFGGFLLEASMQLAF